MRKFFLGYVNHQKDGVRAGAIGALGTLGDPKAMPIVETFSRDDPADRIQRATKDALKKLQEQKPLVPAEIIRLREAVEKLQEETEKLKNNLEDLKKRLDAKEKT